MAEIVFITGGQRSGKSRYAQQRALQDSNSPYYLATSRIWDEDFRRRVERHQADRDQRWTTLEEDSRISKAAIPPGSVVVLDCITLWITNLFSDNDLDEERALKLAREEWDRFNQQDIKVYVVSNEIGMGLHGNTPELRGFQDLQGFINQYIASAAAETWFMVSGQALRVK